MSFTLVQQTPTNGGLAIFPFNNSGDVLVAVIMGVATTPDFTAFPVLASDSAGNTWKLIASSINAGTAAGGGVAMAAYMCAGCIGSLGSNTFSNPATFPVDLINSSMMGLEFSYSYPNAVGQAESIAFPVIVPFDFGSTPVTFTPETLIIASVMDAAQTGLATFASGGLLPLTSDTGGETINAYLDISAGGTLPVVNVDLGASTNPFGLMIRLQGSNSGTGGGNAQTLSPSLNKGPIPIVPKEGRVILTYQIDCTQQRITPLPINFPEFALYQSGGVSEPVGATILTFDLEHLFQGSGLSEVRTIICWSRPGFGLVNGDRQDVPPANNFVFPALLTNTSTLQTVMLGGNAVNQMRLSQQTYYADYQIIPFPANKNSLRFRFIAPQQSSALGKYNLAFLNFEVMGAVESLGSFLTTTSD